MDKADRLQLNGLKVLVTRPKEQAAPLTEAISSYGGIPVEFPLLEIEPVSTKPPALDHLDKYNVIIFVSRNAVKHAWPFLSTGLPSHIKVAVVGQGTADELNSHHQQVHYLPSVSFDSEGLLALEAFQSLEGQRILIVRGQSGREHLASVLKQRGAEVEYVEVYQRLKTKRALTDEYADIDAIVVSSSEAIKHLAKCAVRDQQNWIFNTQIVAIHPRIAMQACELGFTLKPVVVDRVHETGLESAIVIALKLVLKS